MGVEPWETENQSISTHIVFAAVRCLCALGPYPSFEPKRDIAQKYRKSACKQQVESWFGYLGKSAQRECGSKVGELFSWNTVMKINIIEFLRDQIN